MRAQKEKKLNNKAFALSRPEALLSIKIRKIIDLVVHRDWDKKGLPVCDQRLWSGRKRQMRLIRSHVGNTVGLEQRGWTSNPAD